MHHGHLNTGRITVRHFAIRGSSPKYTQDRYRTPLHNMIPLDEEPPEIHRDFLAEIERKGITGDVAIVKE